jgi:hypothetical protein
MNAARTCDQNGVIPTRGSGDHFDTFQDLAGFSQVDRIRNHGFMADTQLTTFIPSKAPNLSIISDYQGMARHRPRYRLLHPTQKTQ